VPIHQYNFPTKIHFGSGSITLLSGALQEANPGYGGYQRHAEQATWFLHQGKVESAETVCRTRQWLT